MEDDNTESKSSPQVATSVIENETNDEMNFDGIEERSVSSNEESQKDVITTANVSGGGGGGPAKPRYCYTKDEMISISKLACSRSRPKCLDVAFNSANGLWNPEKWMTSKRGDSNSSLTTMSTVAFKRDRHLNDGHDKETIVNVKRKNCDQKERLKEEAQDEIVLSPQRRSFGTGCHVSSFRNDNRSSHQETDHQTTGSLSSSSHRSSRNGQQSRVGSGRLVTSRDRGSEWSERFDERRNNGFNRDDDNNGGRKGRFNNNRFNNNSSNNNNNSNSNNNNNSNCSNEFNENPRRSLNSSRRSSGYRDHRSFDEPDEPEWFTGGPTSQNETIELKGFDEYEEEKMLNKSSNKSVERRSRHNSCNQTKQEQPQPQPQLQQSKEENRPRSRQPSGKKEQQQQQQQQQLLLQQQEFDINEMFKMENWKTVQNESVTNSIPVNVNAINQTTGTSRFAQWFSESKRESSPIDRLFANATQQQQYHHHHHHHHHHLSSGDMSSFVAGDSAAPNIINRKNEDEKDIINLFQKANINVSHLMQQQQQHHQHQHHHHHHQNVVNFDAKSVKRVSDLEASLKADSLPLPSTASAAQSNESNAFIKLFDHLEKPSIEKQREEAATTKQQQQQQQQQQIFDTSNIVDLLKEDDLFAINQHLNANNSVQQQNHHQFQQQKFNAPEFMASFASSKPIVRQSHGLPLQSDSSVDNISSHHQQQQQQQQQRNNSNIVASPFTPTSVIRKFASEKEKSLISDENKQQSSQQSFNGLSSSQCLISPRPIVKSTTQQPQPIPPPMNNYNSSDFNSLAKFIEQQRLQQQQQQAVTNAALAAQRQLNISPMSSSAAVAAAAAAAAALRMTASNATNLRPNLPTSNNISLMRNMAVNPSPAAAVAAAAAAAAAVRSNPLMNPLQFQMMSLGTQPTTQHQQQQPPPPQPPSAPTAVTATGPALDPRQLQAFAQTRGLHPVALQQLLIKAAAANIQTHAAAAAAAVSVAAQAQAQAAAVASLGITGPRPVPVQSMSPTRHMSLRPEMGQKEIGQLVDLENHQNFNDTFEMQGHVMNRQSSENLTKWFGNEVLNQKLPEMPPVPLQQALLLEDIERQ